MAKSVQRRRPQGSGGIFQVADDVWKVDIELPRDPVTGRRRRPSRTVRGTRTEAELALARLKDAGDKKRLPSGGTNARTVGAAMGQYIEAAESGSLQLAPKTITTSRSAVKVMSNTMFVNGHTFGSIRLSRLTWEDIEALYGAMRRSGRGADWTRRCGTVLTRSLDLARKRGLIDSNPAKDAIRPKSTRKKPYSPPAEEVRAALETARERDPEVADLVVLLASTGMRSGEALGLQWGDVDPSGTEIHVAAAVSDGGPGVGLVRKATKRSDWRDVPLTEAAAQSIRRQSDRYQTRFGSSPPRTTYLFGITPDHVRPMRPDALNRRWTAARGSAAITFLHLRHFVATTMLDAGESYRTVAEILGNSEATLRLHYDGRTGIEKRKAISALEL